MGDEVDFLPVDKEKNFLKVYSITLTVDSLACLRTQNNKFLTSLQYLIENLILILNLTFFCLQINAKGFFKFILSL